MIDIISSKEIQSTLRWLRHELNEAIWNADKDEEARLVKEIGRLEMLTSYGETHDVSF